MTKINTSLISAFQHSFSPSPLSSASSSPTSTLSTYSRRHNSCNDNLSFDYSVQPLIPLETEKSLNNDSHDFIYRRNSNTIEYRRPKKEIASWKKSFSELSEKLGEICESSSSICLESTPKSKSCLSSQSLSSSPMNHFKLKDKLKVVKINDSFDEILNKKNSNSTELVRKPQMKRAESLFEAVPFYKNIAVRHLETNLRLQNQLFQITKKSNTSGKLGIDTFDDLNDASISFTDYQLSSLQSQKINFQEQILLPSLEDFKVELVDGNLIVVKNSCNSGHIILEAKIEKPINNNCICFMDNSKNLFLNCYLSSIVSLNTGQGTNSFIPVVTQNSNSKGGYIVSIHIPKEFKSEDLIVKTIDNLLNVSCMHRRTSMGKVDRRLHSSLSNSSIGSNLTMGIQLLLPASVNSRSVSASLTNHHQLIVKSIRI